MVCRQPIVKQENCCLLSRSTIKNPDICRGCEHNVMLISPDACREQNNVADGMAVGEQHYHTSIPIPRPAVGGKPCSSAVTYLRRRTSLRRRLRLSRQPDPEALRLIFRVIQLAKAVTDFTPPMKNSKRSVISGLTSLRRAAEKLLPDIQ